MDHRPKCKMQNYKNLEDRIRENPGDFGFGIEFLDTTPKAWPMKEKINKCDFIKVKTSALQMTLLREWKDKPQAGRIYLQNISDKGLLLKIYKELWKLSN